MPEVNQHPNIIWTFGGMYITTIDTHIKLIIILPKINPNLSRFESSEDPYQLASVKPADKDLLCLPLYL